MRNNVQVVREQEKKNFLLKKLKDFFLFDIQPEFKYLSNCIFTITNVVVLDKGLILKVYFTFFSIDKNKTNYNILHFLNRKKKTIRWMFGQKMGNELKFVPRLDFYIDNTCEEMKKIDDLFKKYQIE